MILLQCAWFSEGMQGISEGSFYLRTIRNDRAGKLRKGVLRA